MQGTVKERKAAVRPFLKWAGGKLRIVDRIQAVLPPGKRLIEPFAGSGALFLNTDYPMYLLADINGDLINLYRQLQAGGAAFVDYCATFFTAEANTAEVYYIRRNHFNTLTDGAEKAALFLYLNRHGYNGLCRYNGTGRFNVPFGRYRVPYFPRVEMLAFLARAGRVELAVAPFTATMERAEPGDVVYCDPPYVPLSTTAHFTSYSADRFGPEEQRLLAAKAAELTHRGVAVVISNHDTSTTRMLYAGAVRHLYFPVARHISRDGANRTAVNEVLAIYLPTALATVGP
jgi:DNA adenine methylase